MATPICFSNHNARGMRMKRIIITASCVVLAGLSAYPASAQDAPEGLLNILQNEVNFCQNSETGASTTVEFYGFDGRRVNWSERELFQIKDINHLAGADGIISISENKDSYYITTTISAWMEPSVTVDWVVYKTHARGDHDPMESRSGPDIHCFWVDDTSADEPEWREDGL